MIGIYTINNPKYKSTETLLTKKEQTVYHKVNIWKSITFLNTNGHY